MLKRNFYYMVPFCGQWGLLCNNIVVFHFLEQETAQSSSSWLSVSKPITMAFATMRPEIKSSAVRSDGPIPRLVFR